MIRGCDVSVMQGSPPYEDMTVIQNIRFAMLRCSIGNDPGVDLKFVENVARARDNGVRVGPYHFAYPLPHLDPRAQAELAAKKAEYEPGRLLGAELGNLPPSLDLEWPPRESRAKDGTLTYPWQKWLCSPAQLRDWGLAYLERAEQLWGCRPLVYTYRYWWACVEGAKAIDYARYPLWLADYFAKGRWPLDEELALRKTPAPWSKITMVQHDGDGGLMLPDDVDADFNCFLGDEDEFNAFCGVPRLEPFVPEVDVAAAHAGALRIIVDENIAAYRRERFEQLTAA